MNIQSVVCGVAILSASNPGQEGVYMHVSGCGCEEYECGHGEIIDRRSIDKSILDGSIRCTGRHNPNVSLDLGVKTVLYTDQPHSRGRPERWL